MGIRFLALLLMFFGNYVLHATNSHLFISEWNQGSYGSYQSIGRQKRALPIFVKATFNEAVTDDIIQAYLNFLKPQLKQLSRTKNHGEIAFTVQGTVIRKDVELIINKANLHFDPEFKVPQERGTIKGDASHQSKTLQQLEKEKFNNLKSEEIQNSGFITEIINNTDKSVYFSVETYDNVYPYITTSISLKTQEETQHLKGSQGGGPTIAPRTRCLIANLKLPEVTASWPRLTGGKMKEFKQGHYMFMNFSFPYLADKQPMPFVGFRQKGNILEILEGEGLHSINLNGQRFSSFHCFENIENNATYTIEINQVTSGIFHRKFNLGTRWFLDSNTLNISIRRNTITPLEVDLKDMHIRPHAYIQSFGPNPSGQVSAVIGFDKLKTVEFLQRFCNFIKCNKFLGWAAQVGMGSQTINLVFYANITKEELQTFIDEANSAPLG